MRTSSSPRKEFRLAALPALALAPYVYAGLFQGPDSAPSEFFSGKVADPVSNLVAKISAGTLQIAYEPRQGYLRSLLKELGISPTSQILVFSKTSLQSAYISPNTPRAIYFNDHAYVGWIPGAPNIEIVGIDPRVGPVFFTLANEPSATPAFTRQTLECFQCHDSPMTGQMPGLMSRSVFAGPDGMPRLSRGSFMTTAVSSISERWGGWYVTGRHGSQRHMGNEVARGGDQTAAIDVEKGANVTDLGPYFGVSSYLTPHSDIVALMVVEQQMTIQNLITKAAYLTSKAIKDSAELVRLKFEPAYVAEETKERIRNACEPLALALVGAREPALTAPMQGTSGFAAYFANTAPADKKGRRLSDLDLKTRLLRYPCSPMIYSEAFTGLPPEAKSQVIVRLREILSGKDQAKLQLNPDDSRDALEILRETLPAFTTSAANN